MSLYDGIQISAQGLSVQRMRMQLVSSNLANISTTKGADGEAYRRRQLVVEAIPKSDFSETVDKMLGNENEEMIHGVRGRRISLDASPLIQKYEPSHPHADERGYVAYPNINPAVEMVDMVGISRSYEANTTAIRTARSMVDETIDLLRTQ